MDSHKYFTVSSDGETVALNINSRARQFHEEILKSWINSVFVFLRMNPMEPQSTNDIGMAVRRPVGLPATCKLLDNIQLDSRFLTRFIPISNRYMVQLLLLNEEKHELLMQVIISSMLVLVICDVG